MPELSASSYHAPFWLPGGHAQTIFPSIFRRVRPVTLLRERIELADGDFLDLEWSGKSAPRLAILSHGLESDARGIYIRGMAAALARRGWDVLAWNFRGCGGEPNRLPHFYHSRATEDLHAIVSHAIARHPAASIDLVGFSLGGNLVLKYLGEDPSRLPGRIHRAVAFSVPCDLGCSARAIASSAGGIYMRRFLRELRGKLRTKHAIFPEKIDLSNIDRIRDFQQFDDRFTAPLHGFRDADDYWTRCSCRQFLGAIRVPVLLINAANDPFLGPACYPREEAAASGFLHLEIPETGGHVGFPSFFEKDGEYWSERRAAGFLTTPRIEL